MNYHDFHLDSNEPNVLLLYIKLSKKNLQLKFYHQVEAKKCELYY